MKISTMASAAGEFAKEAVTFDPTEDNTIKKVSWLVTLVIAVLGAGFWVDHHYASAADMEYATQQLRAVPQIIQYQGDQNRKKLLEDAVFEYSLVPDRNHSQIDRALNERHKQEIKDITMRWRNFNPDTGKMTP